MTPAKGEEKGRGREKKKRGGKGSFRSRAAPQQAAARARHAHITYSKKGGEKGGRRRGGRRGKRRKGEKKKEEGENPHPPGASAPLERGRPRSLRWRCRMVWLATEIPGSRLQHHGLRTRGWGAALLIIDERAGPDKPHRLGSTLPRPNGRQPTHTAERGTCGRLDARTAGGRWKLIGGGPT
jgi:hypothetical protein